MSTIKRLAILPYTSGVGGPASFRQRISAGLAPHGISVADTLDTPGIDAVLLISSWRELGKLQRLKNQGIPILQRLDGINWMHRKTPFNPRYWLKAEYGNWLMRYTRDHLADHIIYQSDFARRRWEDVFGPAPVPHTIIHNSIDLSEYTPQGDALPPEGRQRIMVIEGSFNSGYDFGLKLALDMASGLQEQYSLPVEVTVAGRIAESLRAKWNAYTRVPLTWLGIIPREQIPTLHRSSALFFSGELNPACPNTVIEALACGLPVVGYDTGALAELVTAEAGTIVPFDADPWNLEIPGTRQLIDAAANILQRQEDYRTGARRRAEAAFSLDQMVHKYVEVLESL